MSIRESRLFLLLVLSLGGSYSHDDDISSAGLIFYYGPKYSDRQSYKLDEAAMILNHPQFDNQRPTHCFMHGYSSSQDRYSAKLLINSYLKANAFNLLTVNWTILSHGEYIEAQRNVLKLAPALADSLLDLFDAGLDGESFVLVGQSLGGTAVAIIGREVVKISNGSVSLSRVSSLEPVNADYHDPYILPPVDTTSAKFVDVIHTDAGERGTTEHVGHADFWPNCGTPIQMGCPPRWINYLCSHIKALAYWAESVVSKSQEKFLSHRAQNCSEFLDNEGGSTNDSSATMGLFCPTSARGDYYLKINSNYGALPVLGVIF